MRIAWLGLVAVTAILAVSSCGALGLVGVAALATWSNGTLFHSEPPAFHVGGTIQGLSGTIVLELTNLELHSTESLIRSEDGPFFFDGSLDDGNQFEVHVQKMPLEQQCIVESASGSVHGGNVTSIQVSCEPRLYSIGGTVTDLNGQLELSINGWPSLALTANGPFTFQTQLSKGRGYAVTVAKHPRAQECPIISGASGVVAGDVDTIAVRCRTFLRLDAQLQAASRVVAQTDFDLRRIPSKDEMGLNNMQTPWGNSVVAGGRFYVADSGSNRILAFDGIPQWTSNASAVFVLGQSDNKSTEPHAGQDGFSAPQGLSSDGKYLAVADRGNYRVVVYGALPTDATAMPTRVFGQPASNTGPTPSTACNDSTLYQPSGIFIGYGRLIVADYRHHRVMIWNLPEGDLPPSGKAADLVLGQRSFTSCASNDSDGNGGEDVPSASTLSFPEGVWTDGKRLLIADTGNNRVLAWSDFPTGHGQPADYVLGQMGFTTQEIGKDSRGMNLPRSIASTGEQLFVADSRNNRVLVWDSFPTVSGTRAERVLGQPDLNSFAQLDPPSSRSLRGPTGVLLATPDVVVTDSGNNRVLIYESH